METEVTPSPVQPRFADPGAVKRLGMVALSTDLTSERDARRLLPEDGVALHVARVAFENPATPDNLAKMGPRLADAAALILPEIDLAALYYSCTSASVTLGDRAVVEAIQKTRPGVPVVTPPDAAVAGFRALGVERIALVAPYLAETTVPMAAYFAQRGLEVVIAQCLGIADDRDIGRVTVETILDAAVAADRPAVEGVFLSCTALAGVEAVAAAEARIGKPVVTSNQAGFWRMLHHAGIAPGPGAPGRLFEVAPPGAAP